jgi:hypothetical protein
MTSSARWTANFISRWTRRPRPSVDWYEEFHREAAEDSRKEGVPPPICWLNPPYSKCREFIAKAAAEARKGCTVVCLVPSRTDTRWWHEHVWDAEKHQPRPGVEVRFIKGRLKFGGSTNSAPFPSVVIVFRPPQAVGAVDPSAADTGKLTTRDSEDSAGVA